MDRKEFLSVFGIGAAAMVCTWCLGGCKAEDAEITAPTNVDFTLDLANPAFSGLKSPGAYLVNSGVIVANTAGGFVALSAACTHQGTTVVFDNSLQEFFCPAHGSLFAPNGGVVRGPAGRPLASYRTTVTGDALRVFS